jgi:hypothetical protein
MPFLNGIFGGNTAGAQGGYQSALLQAIGAQNAVNTLTPQYQKAEDRYKTNYYDPYTSAGTDALDMYQNALGLKGPGGNKTAQSAFQVGPGYQFALDQGIQALDRSAAGKGLYGSGSNAMALQQFGQGLANQEYGNWLNALAGLGNTGLTAASGQTQRQGQLAGIDTGLGNAIGGIYSGLGQNAGKAISEGQIADAASNAQGTGNFFSALLGGANLGPKFFQTPVSKPT